MAKVEIAATWYNNEPDADLPGTVEKWLSTLNRIRENPTAIKGSVVIDSAYIEGRYDDAPFSVHLSSPITLIQFDVLIRFEYFDDENMNEGDIEDGNGIWSVSIDVNGNTLMSSYDTLDEVKTTIAEMLVDEYNKVWVVIQEEDILKRIRE